MLAQISAAPMRNAIRNLLILLIAGSASAQITILKNFGSDEGLCQSHVFSLCEDRSGFLWIGTYNGVSRWDGMGFLTFDKSNGLAGNQVIAIHEGRDSTIYFGTDEGLSCYRSGQLDTNSFKDLASGERVQAIHQSADGALFIGTAQSGILVCREGRVDTLNLRGGLPSNTITGFAETADSTLVIGTRNGVCFLKDGRLALMPELAGVAITHICPLAGDGLAFTTLRRGILIYHDRRVAAAACNEKLIQARVYAVAEDSDGTLYCATFGRGVLILRNGQLQQQLTEENGLPHNNVFALLASRSGALYIGTVAGLGIYKQGMLSVYNEDVGIAKNFVVSICPGRDGSVYFGTFGGGITRLRSGRYEGLTHKEGLAGDMVYCVREIDGVLYCGTTAGLSILQQGRFLTLAKSAAGQPLRIRSILPAPRGGILLADAEGLLLLRGGKIELLSKVHNRHILAMDGDGAGHLYLATDKGAFTFCRGQLDSVTVVPQTTVFSVRCLRDGRICFGTDIGLYIAEGDSGRLLTVKDGLLHNSIADILEDPAGRIFLLTMRGVNILDPSRQHLIIRSLQHSDGLANDECSANSGCVDRRGRIWIGSIRGAACYDPLLDRPHTVPPQMHIESMRLFDREIPEYQRLAAPDFAHDQNYFKFDFIGINLRAPDKVRYRYRMAGVDAQWVETRERFVQYTSLDDGHYAFEVKGCNEWGVWSEPARVRFSIAPAFWERWWFLASIILVAAGTAAFLITHRVRRLLSIERLRAHIAADLHDQIGSGLTEIAILSEAAGQKWAGTSPQVAPALQKISEISGALIDSMSDIVWLVNPKRDSLYDLLLRLKDSYDEVLTAAGISLQTRNLQQLEKLHLPMNCRQNLYLILKEAFTNCLKHSGCRNIVVQAGIRRGYLHLAIADDGIGFYPQHDGHGNGLANMKRRAQVIGGALTVHSEPGSGTTISYDGRIQSKYFESKLS
jgi:ligand-binding sensor domain-containing protein